MKRASLIAAAVFLLALLAALAGCGGCALFFPEGTMTMEVGTHE